MKASFILLSAATAALLAGCTTADGAYGPAPVAAAPAGAHTTLLAADGASHGTATVVEVPEGLRVTIKATGLPPGPHAAHVHMTGICAAPDFTSAGGHWNPTGRKHGRDNPDGMHLGDMPNILIGTDGTGELEYTIAGGTIATGANAVLDADGGAVVIHAGPDDMVSDPAGNAGGRIACGVLTAG